jgi:hypothetical protein
MTQRHRPAQNFHGIFIRIDYTGRSFGPSLVEAKGFLQVLYAIRTVRRRNAHKDRTDTSCALFWRK